MFERLHISLHSHIMPLLTEEKTKQIYGLFVHSVQLALFTTRPATE